MDTATLKPASRRVFLKAAGAAAALATIPVWASPRRLTAEDGASGADGAKPAAPSAPGAGKTKGLIIISLPGGPSHIDMFDPKAVEQSKGPFDPIETSQSGVKFTSVLPGLAKRAEHLCVVRSMTSTEGNHDRARYLTLTGHVPNPSVSHPSLGCMLNKEFTPADSEMPGFVAIGGASVDAGYLGPQFAPLIVNDPNKGLENLSYRKGLTHEAEKARLERRLKLRDEIDREFKKDRNTQIAEDQKAMYDRAKRLMDSKKAAAFDLSLEDKGVRDQYGRDRFGQSLVLARRLIEQGVKCVEVRLNGWDTHNDAANRLTGLCTTLDGGFSALIDDLRKKKLFDSVGVLCYGEFGRTPRDGKNDGRGHYPRAWSMVAAGGGFARGRTVGATDDKGEAVISRPVTVPDFFWSMAHTTGFDPLRKFEVNERPIWYADKAGKVIPEFFA
jgi:hypothetical protein